MVRDREYDSNAERQKAYRERQKERLEYLERWVARRTRGATINDARVVKLKKLLGMLMSDSANERSNAATKIKTELKRMKKTSGHYRDNDT